MATSDPLAGIHLHRVADFDVIPAVKQNAAFEALAYLVHVVLLATQRGELSVPDLLAPTAQAHPVAAVDHPIAHRAPSDTAAARLEDLQHLGMTLDDLFVARLEH